MKRRRLAMLCGALVGTLAAPLQAQQLNAAQSEIAFTSRQMGVPVDGRFRSFTAQLAFDPKQPDAARIAFTIDLASVSFGATETEVEVAKPEWFDSRAFPQAAFRSRAVKAAGPDRYEVAGTLTIKGASRDIVVPVALARSGSAATATGSFTIKRLDFRIGDGDWKDTSMVADEVQVRFRLALTGVGAS